MEQERAGHHAVGAESQGGGPVEPAPGPTPLEPESGYSTTVLLSVMMFLQFGLWGAWFVTLGPYLGALGKQDWIPWAYATAPIAAIVSPLFLGIVADRYFSSQRVMGVLHVLGGLILLLAPWAAGSGSQTLFVGVLLVHMLCYMPTLGLSNTVAFRAMSRPDKQFPLVRVWGTVGWIVAGFAVGLLAARLATTTGLSDAEAEAARASVPAFWYVSAGVAVALGVFSFFALPMTPAPLKGERVSVGTMLGLDTLNLMRDRNFAVFIVGSLLICIPLAAYYQQAAAYATNAGVQNVPIKMTFGQMSEILFMLVMPLLFVRLGVKWMLTIGMFAWVLRYVLFGGAWVGDGPAAAASMLIIGGIVLHGICYDFFFVTGQIYTEQRAPKQIRAQAQGFLVLVTQGVGMLAGTVLVGTLVGENTSETGATDWRTVWLIPAAFAGVVMIAFFALFRGEGRGRSERTGRAMDTGDEPTAGLVGA